MAWPAWLSLALGLGLLGVARAEPGLTWRVEHDTTALLAAGQPLWVFQHGTSLSKPYLDGLALPGGPAVTWVNPPDHIWHWGLWFCWKYINGLNYWEEDAAHHSEGRTEWDEATVELRSGWRARFTLNLRYRPPDKDAVLTERRTLETVPPAADGAWHCDWTQVFTALHDVRLDRTALPGEPGGQSWGGYAGLSLRLASGFGDLAAVGATGPFELPGGTRRGEAGNGMDYAGTLAGQTVGVTMLYHPASTLPTPLWYVIRDGMHFFSPVVLCRRPVELHAGESMTLRHRVLLHPGRWDAPRVQRELAAYTEVPLP